MLGASVGVREREALPTGGGTRTIETVPVRRRDDPVGSVPGPAARVEPSDWVIHSRSDRDADEERDHGRMERMERSFSERLHRMERRLGRAEAREPSEDERDLEPRASGTVRGEERRGHTGAVAGSAAAAGTAATLGWRRHREREEERGERREEERGARDPQAIVSGLADEVPRERWGELLEALSELHHEDAVRVEVDGRVEGRRPLIDNSPLMGLGFEPRGGEEGIDIVVGRGLELYDHRFPVPSTSSSARTPAAAPRACPSRTRRGTGR